MVMPPRRAGYPFARSRDHRVSVRNRRLATAVLALVALVVLGASLVRAGGLIEKPGWPQQVAVWDTDGATRVRLLSYDLPGCPWALATQRAGIPSHLAWLPVDGRLLYLEYRGVRVPSIVGFKATGHRLDGMWLYAMTAEREDPPNTLYVVKEEITDERIRTAYVYRDFTWFRRHGSPCLPRERPAG